LAPFRSPIPLPHRKRGRGRLREPHGPHAALSNATLIAGARLEDQNAKILLARPLATSSAEVRPSASDRLHQTKRTRKTPPTILPLANPLFDATFTLNQDLHLGTPVLHILPNPPFLYAGSKVGW